MSYYAVTGRIPGDDDDTVVCVGLCASVETAHAKFRHEMADMNFLDEESANHLIKHYGDYVFIVSTVCSDTPIVAVN